jgi:SAM-dependent methyltransferase
MLAFHAHEKYKHLSVIKYEDYYEGSKQVDQRYHNTQFVTHKSHEIEIPRWYEGQKRFIEEWMTDIPKYAKILDIACVGFRHFRELGYENVTGVGREASKQALDNEYGYLVLALDMHRLGAIPDDSYDVVYASHAIEHSHNPILVVEGIRRILKPGGKLVVVLPYPDAGPDNAHCGKFALGTNNSDNAISVRNFFWLSGFKIYEWKVDSFREPEVWLKMENAKDLGQA